MLSDIKRMVAIGPLFYKLENSDILKWICLFLYELRKLDYSKIIKYIRKKDVYNYKFNSWSYLFKTKVIPDDKEKSRLIFEFGTLSYKLEDAKNVVDTYVDIINEGKKSSEQIYFDSESCYGHEHLDKVMAYIDYRDNLEIEIRNLKFKNRTKVKCELYLNVVRKNSLVGSRYLSSPSFDYYGNYKASTKGIYKYKKKKFIFPEHKDKQEYCLHYNDMKRFIIKTLLSSNLFIETIERESSVYARKNIYYGDITSYDIYDQIMENGKFTIKNFNYNGKFYFDVDVEFDIPTMCYYGDGLIELGRFYMDDEVECVNSD